MDDFKLQNNKYRKSHALFKEAEAVTPLGAQTFSKSHRYFVDGHAPLFMHRGKGAYVWDIDGNRFTDFICALGPITLGYNYGAVNRAISKQLKKGIIFSTQSACEAELAKILTRVIPCAESVRFVKNGGDATTAAIRLARAFTGKERIAKSGYHGMHDWSIGVSENNAGVPEAVKQLTHNFVYNDVNSLDEVLSAHKGEFAAVILEPIQANGAKPGYLEEVKRTAHRHGALLIFDEVVSGFRYAVGGASEYYGVVPDMAALGKGLANGMPLSAVVGRREIINLISDGVFISTTFGGDALSLAAGIATVNELIQKKAIERFWHLGGIMHKGITLLSDKYRLGDTVTAFGLAPHCGISINKKGALSVTDINSIYSYYMLENGILAHAVTNVCLSHTEKDIENFLYAVDTAFAAIARAIKQDSAQGIIPPGRISPVFKRNIG